MSKQDRQQVRTAHGLEQKYNFNNLFSRLDSENNQQNLTMRQFAELITETIGTIQKNIEGLNISVETLTKKDKELAEKDTAIDDKISAYWKTVYPVGAIYVSVSSTSPATLFGGTWEQIEDTFLLAAGSTYSAGATGGEATHTLTVSEMPSHKHTPGNYDTAGSDTSYKRLFTTNLGTGSASVSRAPFDKGSTYYAMAATTYTDINETAYTSSVGGSGAHNNMPPYLAVYVWKRVS